MRQVSYVFLRGDTGRYFFRWTIPATARHLFGGRTEVKRSLCTDQRGLALRLARRLSVMLEHSVTQLMVGQLYRQDEAVMCLTIQTLERLMDGAIRMQGVQLDPAHAETEMRMLEGILGKGAAASKGTDAAKGATLRDLVKAYFADGERAKSWTLKSRQEIESSLELVLEVVGETKPLAELSRRDFSRLKEVLSKLPSNRTKNPLYRGQSALELAGRKIPTDHLMGVLNINKVLSRASTLLHWGKLNGFLPENYAEGLALAKEKRSDEYRQPYTAEEVRLVREAVLAGTHGTDKHPWQKWIPLLLMYQGMRINEVAQLALADFDEVDGIPVVHIREGAGQRLKTLAAKRTIPIHPELIRLGLLDHIGELRKRSGTVRAWPQLPGGRDGYGQAASRFYARFRAKLGLSKDAHSFRHTVIHKLRETGAPEDLIADMVGHSRSKSVTFNTYAKSALIQRMAEALAKLSYEQRVPSLKLAA